ncbi:ECF-type sigma factor [Pelagicoccus mobilis]|uniref:Sigma-70 family RNA polymerase sigma factor n=1 Tax=Pelagicoccus mobilis TaxID=415221 RepID=A0A934RTM3_9BACT|nr:ECF-type sigma factor [Pelagicoccus mobilis]MBK1877375.1 sigma-70 family RNA polymerase sigma factor [Pelagicoccus mobilis]
MLRTKQAAPGSAPKRKKSRVELTTTLYGDLRKLAQSRMSGQQAPQTLQATALVHEAWLRLGCDKQPAWKNPNHFYAAVAETMRHILIDRARWRKRVRHGGALKRVDLNTWNWENVETASVAKIDDQTLALSEALETLNQGDSDTAELVKLHYFTGLTLKEAAEFLGFSERTAQRRLAFAKAWLGREMSDQAINSAPPRQA